MGHASERADRFVRKTFGQPPPQPATVEQKEVQTRAEKLALIANRAVLRRKGF